MKGNLFVINILNKEIFFLSCSQIYFFLFLSPSLGQVPGRFQALPLDVVPVTDNVVWEWLEMAGHGGKCMYQYVYIYTFFFLNLCWDFPELGNLGADLLDFFWPLGSGDTL